MDRMLIWRGVDSWRAEVARVDLDEQAMSAVGTQIGVDPLPYRLDYRLMTTTPWITKRLEVEAVGEGWRRRLVLSHDGSGGWTEQVDYDGDADLPIPGCDVAVLTEARDCDLGGCPLTNTMPIRRYELHTRDVAVDFVMAWVSVPDLRVFHSVQRYEHVRRNDDGTSVVRYLSRDGDFVSELTVDADGLVLDYPQLATAARARD
jgi:uncharacterized protein